MGPPTNQVRAWIILHLQLLLTTPQDQVGCGAPEIDHATMPEVSPQPTAGSQTLWALWWVTTLSAPRSLKVARNQAVNLNSPTMRKMAPMKMRMPRQTRVKLRLQAMARQHPMAKSGKNTLKLKTPSLALAKSLVCTRTPTQSLTLRRRPSPSGRSGTNQVPRRTPPPKELSESSSEEEPPTDEALCNEAWQRAQQLDTNFDAWHHKKIAKGITGWATRDTMICDLPKHGKVQPNHPDPMGPPLDYMGDCQVFDGIQSDIYDLCRFYTLGMTGDLPEFPAPWQPATHRQIRDLLKSARSIGRPYMILVHSTDLVTAVSMLREMHTAACL